MYSNMFLVRIFLFSMHFDKGALKGNVALSRSNTKYIWAQEKTRSASDKLNRAAKLLIGKEKKNRFDC